MADRTKEMTRLELMLKDASIKLSSVASALSTVWARAMLTAMIDGETNPLVLADMARGKMRRRIPELACDTRPPRRLPGSKVIPCTITARASRPEASDPIPSAPAEVAVGRSTLP